MKQPALHSLQLLLVVLIAALLIGGCSSGSEQKQTDQALPQDWQSLKKQARGQSLHFMMWQGDPLINRYIQDYIKPRIKEKYGIQLNILGGQGSEIEKLLMSELEAGQQTSEIDMVWINGETFYRLRKIKALYGPFTDRLPNNRYIDWDAPFLAKDFQKPVEGMECPWGRVQMALIYDTTRLSAPPRSTEALAQWIKSHPGRFTIPNHFTGYTFLKSLMYAFAEKPEVLHGEFSQATYQKLSTQVWDYLKPLRPYFWKKGQTYPNSVAKMHRLFANGEIDFTMSNNDAEVDNKIKQEVLPRSARAYVPSWGSIRNTHYLGIPKLSGKKAAAMVVINEMISPAAQFEKMKPETWGDGTVLAREKLPEQWQEKFHEVPGRKHAPPRKGLRQKALMEPAPQYMIRLIQDFRKHLIEN